MIFQPVIIRGEATGETGQKEYIFTADGRSSILFSLPGTLAYAPSHAKPLQSDIHRLNLSFNLDGEKFFVDASFHIKVVYDGLKWEIPVPTGGLP